MNALTFTLAVINTVACAITCWYALCGLNACTRQTSIAVRLSFAAIAIGSFAALLNPPDPDIGGGGTLLVFTGVAVGFLANRRQCVCLNCPARGGKRRPAPINTEGGHPA